jgi:16S rRNA (guanine966-N2)-methyltransferase
MRIIGGEYGGRVIRTHGNLEVRPTTDMGKEALFNILSNRMDFDDLRVLDLFAGTGGIGMEFASRQARQVICIENDSRNSAFILQTANKFGMRNLQVLRADVFKVLQNLVGPFDVIFADPPYDLPELATIPSLILESGLLGPEGILILEHGPKNTFQQHHGFTEERRYGKVRFSFFSALSE